MSESAFTNARYLNFGTFRKSGARIDTPVWFAADKGVFYAFSNNMAGKIKRLKNSNHCVIAPCTMMGKPTGAWQETDAVLLDKPDEIKAAHASLKKKYGWQMLMLDAGATLGGRIEQRSYIRIRQPQ